MDDMWFEPTASEAQQQQRDWRDSKLGRQYRQQQLLQHLERQVNEEQQLLARRQLLAWSMLQHPRLGADADRCAASLPPELADAIGKKLRIDCVSRHTRKRKGKRPRWEWSPHVATLVVRQNAGTSAFECRPSRHWRRLQPTETAERTGDSGGDAEERLSTIDKLQWLMASRDRGCQGYSHLRDGGYSLSQLQRMSGAQLREQLALQRALCERIQSRDW
jgi:hypothetical protein